METIVTLAQRKFVLDFFEWVNNSYMASYEDDGTYWVSWSGSNGSKKYTIGQLYDKYINRQDAGK